MRDGVVAEQGGGDARGRRRVLVGGRAVRHQRRGDLVGRENVLVRARPVGQQRARGGLRLRVLRARRPVVGQQRVHLRRGVVGQQRSRDGAGRLGVLRRSCSVVDQQRVHLRRGVVGQQRSREGRVRRCDGAAVGRDAQRVVAVGQRSRERSLQMQVANDVASANELPSREARPGRRVNNSAAAEGGELRWGCSSWPPRPPARRRLTGLPCWRDPWSASSAAQRCCCRARPPVRLWWPGLLPWPGARLPAPVRCCPASTPACGDPVVQGLDGGCVVAGGCRVHRQVCYLRVGRQSKGQLPCGDVRTVTSPLSRISGMLPVTGPSNMFTYVFADALVQWLRRRPRS